MYLKLFVLAVFLICYILIATVKKHTLVIIFAGVIILLISPALTIKQALGWIDLNVLGIFWGIMVLSFLFIYSGAPKLLAGKLVSKSASVVGALLAVCGLSAFISSYTENVATVLIVGPIAIEIALALGINPIPFIIGVAVSSNLQGCATLIGDPPSIILASSSGMNFNDFFWLQGKPGIFFAVQLGAVGSFLVLYLAFKKYRGKPTPVTTEPVKTWLPSFFIAASVITLIIISLSGTQHDQAIGIACFIWGLIGIGWHHFSKREAINLLKDLDWHTLFFLAGIFILVGSLTQVGLISDLAQLMVKLTQAHPLGSFILIILISVIVSAFVDNVPYTIAMIPVAKIIAAKTGLSPYPYLFGLLIGACLGGNITPIGASCNITAVGLLRRHGYRVSFLDFIKLGLPFTLTAVTIASIFIWLVWSR